MRFIRTLPLLVLFGSGCSGSDTDPIPVGDMAVGDVDMPQDMFMPPDTNSSPKKEGELCDNPNQCEEGTACTGDKDKQQFRCMRGCPEVGRICTEGQVCIELGPSAKLSAVCYLGGSLEPGASCQSNLECPLGHSCFGTDTNKYCLPACHINDDVCPKGTQCLAGNTGKGFCRKSTSYRCNDDTECMPLGDNFVCSSNFSEANTLLATPSCTKSCANDTECPTGSVCSSISDTQKICLSSCQSDGTCRFNEGNRCRQTSECDGASDTDRCKKLFGTQPELGLCLGGLP